MIKAQTLKGFRDFLPKEARKRQYVINTLKEVFESYGFEPLETPALEYEEVLLGKYGEEGDKLMYRFEDNGKRRVALRYDQTVPLARVVAQYQNELPSPFKRYQIQNVYRAENTQKGRFREFLQCDADVVGTLSKVADAELLALVRSCLVSLKLETEIQINSRKILFSMMKDLSIQQDKWATTILTIDKLTKVDDKSLDEELEKKGLGQNVFTSKINPYIQNLNLEFSKSGKTGDDDLDFIIETVVSMNVSKDDIKFVPSLARGLDYYTGMIFEIVSNEYTAGSLCGGGRYDNLIGMFAGRQIPAVGFAFGFDRIMEAMEELKLFPEDLSGTKVLVTVFSKELGEESMKVASQLRFENINTELWLDAETKLEKQLKYADQKQIPYVVVIGPEEAEKNVVQLKNMKTREQQQFSMEETVTFLSS